MLVFGSTLATTLLSGMLCLGPARDLTRSSEPSPQVLERLTLALKAHLGRTVGIEKLPLAVGRPLQPGFFVTLTTSGMWLGDRRTSDFQAGRAKGDAAPECLSGCPGVIYDAFLQHWVELALEATMMGLEIPGRVLIAAASDLPAVTLVHVVNAVAETRPVSPPALALVVQSGRAGLRMLPVFVLPPGGLVAQPGSLGLDIVVEGDERFRVRTSDPNDRRAFEVQGTAALVSALRDLKRAYPNKETVILRPAGDATVERLVATAVAIGDEFPLTVLGMDQPVRVR